MSHIKNLPEFKLSKILISIKKKKLNRNRKNYNIIKNM